MWIEDDEDVDIWPASWVKWKIAEGSMEPERVAPGRPARGVRPMDVSWDCPCLMQHAEAPEPRWRAIMLSSVAGLRR